MTKGRWRLINGKVKPAVSIMLEPKSCIPCIRRNADERRRKKQRHLVSCPIECWPALVPAGLSYLDQFELVQPNSISGSRLKIFEKNSKKILNKKEIKNKKN